MTNREWLESLDNKTFALLIGSCGSCIGYGSRAVHCSTSCPDGKLKWLRQEHKSCPNLKTLKEDW